MNLTHIFTDPPILIVISTFLYATIYTIKSYKNVSKNLVIFNEFISKYKKNDLNFRFNEIDEWMCNNPYVSAMWLEFKNTLVFSESVALKNENNQLTYKEVSSTIQNIQTTVDPLYFFNEETLAQKKYNAKLIGTFPTILTGFGPLFTFLNIAIAFGKIDFSSQERTVASVANLMSSMQVAALVSVIAVGASLTFMIMENILFSRMCRGKIAHAEDMMAKLFDNISSEKFLLELLKETKNIAIDATSTLVDLANRRFTYEFLSKSDPINFVLGKLCSCCAHLEGAGNGIMRASIVHPDVQNIVIRDKNGVIVAKSTLYVNRAEGYGVCNNVEVNNNVSDEDAELIYKKFKKAVETFAEKYNVKYPDKPLKIITVGMNLNDLSSQITKNDKQSNELYQALNYGTYAYSGSGYNGDSKNSQYVVWENTDLTDGQTL